jgi:anti-sigma regulatory factor (Ser/Thr protein kinase)
MNVRTSTRFRRERTAVPPARAFVRHALRSGGAPLDVIDRVELAVAEACNNAILHSGSAVFTVRVVVEGDRAVVAVADDGAGFDPPRNPTMPAPDAIGHRGLALMRALVDHVDVSSTAAGTTVVLTEPFARRARGAEPQRVGAADGSQAGRSAS